MVRLRMIYAWVFHIITELNGYGVSMNLIDIYIYRFSLMEIQGRHESNPGKFIHPTMVTHKFRDPWN